MESLVECPFTEDSVERSTADDAADEAKEIRLEPSIDHAIESNLELTSKNAAIADVVTCSVEEIPVESKQDEFHPQNSSQEEASNCTDDTIVGQTPVTEAQEIKATSLPKEKSSDSLTKSETKQTRTPSRTSLRQRQRRESPPEMPLEQTAPKTVIVKERVPPIERPINWFEGDLVWSLVSGHPLWPCMVTSDSETGLYTKMKGSGTGSCRSYHVQFFGDSPEHAWINDSRVFKFSGKDEYESLVRSIAKKVPKRPPKVEISSRFLRNWNAAIDEINVAVPMTNIERQAKYTFIYIDNMPKKPGDHQNEDVCYAEEAGTVDTKMAKGKENTMTGVKETLSTNGLRVDGEQLLSVTDTLEFVIKKYSGHSGKKDTNDQTPNSDLEELKSEVGFIQKPHSSEDNVLSTSKKSYACLYCSDIYFSLSSMQKHHEEKHPDSDMYVSGAKPSNGKLGSPAGGKRIESESNNICRICGQNFANKRSLGQHRRFSHPDAGLGINAEQTKSPLQEKRLSLPPDLIAIPIPLNKHKTESTPTTNRVRSRPLLTSQGKKDPICVICEKNGDVITCNGDCCRSFHIQCLGDRDVCDPFVCNECKTNTHTCIICNQPGSSKDGLGELKRCVVALCGRFFHSTCLQIYKLKGSSDTTDKTLSGGPNTRCPSHSCATCSSKALLEANRGGNTHFKNKAQNRAKLFKCVRCPVAYHISDDCLAAGAVILGGLNIVCPAHFKPVKTVNHHHPVHISWCFVCSKGGELICCASCPAAFHAQCIDLEKTPDGDWHCLDCSCGIRPLYDDIVWVKLGTYRWWPGQVTHPNDIPDNISRLQHGPGEFVVKFFGSNDYFWLSKCRVFLYQEGDNGATNRHCSRGISGVFKKALQEAEETFREVTTARQLQEEVKTAVNGKKPAPYKHIKCNKPVGNVQIHTAALSEIAKCTCKRTDPHPCGPESECLNRMLMYECHPAVCPASDRCENQRFQRCEYPPTEVFKTTWGGWGLRTTVFIKKSSFVNEYVGELVDEEECKRRIERSHERNITNFYMLTIDKDRIIDAGPKGNFSRFMNHCCAPNCETQKWMVNGDTRVGLFALKDIMPGEELTFNYNLDCLGNDKTKCMCGSENCSGFIGVRPKAQMDGIKRERRKKRKYRRVEHLPQHDDFCFRCRRTGTLVCCDFKGCMRAFCLECLHLDKPPYGKWECPCHHCDWCGRRAQYFCSFCPNSFCGSHVRNQLRPSIPNKFDTCLDHDPKKAEFEMAQIVAMVNDLMNAPIRNMEACPVPSPVHLPDDSPNSTDSGQDSTSSKSTPMVGQKRKRKSIYANQGKRSRKSPDIE